MGKNPSEKAKQQVVRGGRAGAQFSGTEKCGFCREPFRISGSKGSKYKMCRNGHSFIRKAGHHNRRRKNKANKRAGKS